MYYSRKEVLDLLDPYGTRRAGAIAGAAASAPKDPTPTAPQSAALEAENAMLRGMLRAARQDADRYQQLYEAEVARRRPPPPPPAPRGSAAWQPLQGRIMDLIRLCHPDRHGGSAVSTEVTQILLDIRDKL